MNRSDTGNWPAWLQDFRGGPGGRAPRGLKRTYRFADGVRVVVWTCDVVVWVYPDGRQVRSVGVGGLPDPDPQG